MSDELDDRDPFDGEEGAGEDVKLISDGMIKKLTYLIHKLANRRNEDFKEIQKKCKKQFGYTNLAKMKLVDGHSMITKLIELTGGEEERNEKPTKDDLSPAQLPTKPDDGLAKIGPKKQEEEQTKEVAQEEEDLVTSTMRKAIRAAVDITNNEIVAKEIPVMGLGGVVLEIGKVIFEAKMAEEVN